MKAYEAREISVKFKYEELIRIVNKAVEAGIMETIVSKGLLDPKVKDMLIDDGYDVILINCDKLEDTYISVSWKNAEQNKKGEYKVIREIETFSDLPDLFIR